MDFRGSTGTGWRLGPAGVGGRTVGEVLPVSPHPRVGGDQVGRRTDLAFAPGAGPPDPLPPRPALHPVPKWTVGRQAF